MPESERPRLSVPRDFDLKAVIASHGWYQLVPWRWNQGKAALEGVLRTVASRPLGVELRPTPSGRARLTLSRRVGPRVRERVLERLRYALSLDVGLAEFHTHCRRHPRLRWIARQRLGRFLRGEDVFEDMAKTLLTTNCTWRQTVWMVGILVDEFGAGAGGGHKAFPEPEALLEAGPDRLREKVRVGYRAPALVELAERARAGELEKLRELPLEALDKALRGFRGFGPYAASSLLLIWGYHEHQIIDSWALARGRELHGGGKPVKPATLRSVYAPHGPHRGLVSWYDLDREHFRRFPPDWLA